MFVSPTIAGQILCTLDVADSSWWSPHGYLVPITLNSMAPEPNRIVILLNESLAGMPSTAQIAGQWCRRKGQSPFNSPSQVSSRSWALAGGY